MSKFETKRGKTLPEISTASLPDIIFILLFFFMVVTVMRETEIKVKNKLPQATELTKLVKKSLVSYIYIGSPVGNYAKLLGNAPRIQLNDAFYTKDDIGQFVAVEREKLAENRQPYMIFSLRVDVDVTMGIISDVKTELRKADALKLNYSARRRLEVEEI